MKHSFDMKVAARHGIKIAVFVENLPSDEFSIYEILDDFLYLSKTQVRRLLERMTQKNLLSIRQGNGTDRTIFYKLNTESIGQ